MLAKLYRTILEERINLYLYLINKPSNEEAVADLECLMITGVRPDGGLAFSDKYVDIRHAAYLDTCVNIYFEKEDLNSLYSCIRDLNYKEDGFRVKYINLDTYIDFKSRKKIECEISNIFPGAPDLKNPSEEFLVTQRNGKWIFGRVETRTENRWRLYSKKPHTFCNALPSRLARAIVNIGTGSQKSVTLLDPCCGVGTVLLEALDIGIDAYGFDINDIVTVNANKNLTSFGFKSRVECRDAASIEGEYDVSIVDLPYGLLSKRGSDRYDDIIGNIRKVSSRSVILSGRNIKDTIISSGFKIKEYCITHKGGLDRHIALCE